jgi:hypothetical protein
MSAAVEKINELDVINAERGVWLVKVPKYMANEWQKGKAGTEIGKLKINKYVNSLLVKCDELTFLSLK